MSKAERNRQQAARERIAAQRAAARRNEVRNRVLITGGSVLAVLVVIAVFIVIKVSGGTSTPPPGSATGTPLPASVQRQVTGVPASTLAKVGAGGSIPKSIFSITGPPLTSGGKPEVLYLGAEYCPFCATERWAMAVALSRFGTFSPLHGIHSSATDTPASIPTLTFYNTTFTSKYLTFTPVELQKVDRTTLQQPTNAQQTLMNTYDVPPRTTTNGSIPFIDFGNKYMIGGATYSYTVLQGKTWAQVAAALNDPSSAIGQAANGAANMLTAAICKITSNQPASVCAAPPIPVLEGQL